MNHQSLLNGTKAYIVELIKETGLWQVEVDIEGDLLDLPAQNISPRPPRAEHPTDPAQNYLEILPVLFDMKYRRSGRAISGTG